MYYTDLRIGEVVYVLVFYILSSSSSSKMTSSCKWPINSTIIPEYRTEKSNPTWNRGNIISEYRTIIAKCVDDKTNRT